MVRILIPTETGGINILVKFQEAHLADFKISLSYIRQMYTKWNYTCMIKNSVCTILYSRNLTQNSWIVELNTPVKYGIYSITYIERQNWLSSLKNWYNVHIEKYCFLHTLEPEIALGTVKSSLSSFPPSSVISW